jgi:hypothetical protein
MLNKTQQGIMDALRTEFPVSEVPNIYLTGVPADFQRPSFFLDLLPWRAVDLTTHMREYPISWQVVYFPPKDESGNEDVMNLRTAGIRLDKLFGQTKTLALPEGIKARITDFSWDERDGAGYATIILSVVLLKVEEEPAFLANLELNMAPNI